MKGKKKILVGVSVVFVILFLIYLEAISRQIENFKKAQEYYKKGDYHNAWIYYQTVLIFYTPFFKKYFLASVDKMFEIAQYYKKNNQIRKALNIYEEIIASINAIRSFYTPFLGIQKKAKELKEECQRLLEKGG